MIALAGRLYAAAPVRAAELVEPTRRNVHSERAIEFVRSVATVEKTIALFLHLKADAARALNILGLALPVNAVGFIGTINAVDNFIASLVLRQTVGLIEDVAAACERTRRAIGWS